MTSFKEYYRRLFQTFGNPLTKRAGTSSKVLTAAGKRLGVRIPPALRDYYLMAGNEHRFNTCHNRLLAPQNWRIDKQRLIFMEENQWVVWWGVSTRNSDSVDPPVSQGINDEDEPISWAQEHRKCSVFLAVMLHYQAVSGGHRFSRTGNAPNDVITRLQNGWDYYGEVNTMKAYCRPNQVVCLMPPGDLPFIQSMTVLASGKAQGDLRAIADDLGLALS